MAVTVMSLAAVVVDWLTHRAGRVLQATMWNPVSTSGTRSRSHASAPGALHPGDSGDVDRVRIAGIASWGSERRRQPTSVLTVLLGSCMRL
jgi:hypothetical protein